MVVINFILGLFLALIVIWGLAILGVAIICTLLAAMGFHPIKRKDSRPLDPWLADR